MDNIKNDLYYVQKIQDDLAFITNSKRLSDDFKKKHGSVPWMAVYGLRNRIVHDYGSVDLGIVFETLKTDIPDLYVLIKMELN